MTPTDLGLSGLKPLTMRRRIIASLISFSLFSLVGPVIRLVLPTEASAGRRASIVNDVVLYVWPTVVFAIGEDNPLSFGLAGREWPFGTGARTPPAARRIPSSFARCASEGFHAPALQMRNSSGAALQMGLPASDRNPQSHG